MGGAGSTPRLSPGNISSHRNQPWIFETKPAGVTRFENTVAAQFHGHTHNDHFQVTMNHIMREKREQKVKIARNFRFIMMRAAAERLALGS